MFAALVGLIVVGHLLICARHGNRIALYMLGAFAIILVAIVNDILHPRPDPDQPIFGRGVDPRRGSASAYFRGS